MDFHAGEISAAEGGCAEVTYARCRRADENQFPLECSRRESSLKNIYDRVMGKSSPRSLVVDEQLAAAIWKDRRLGAERNFPNSRWPVKQIGVLGFVANQGPSGHKV